MLVSSVNLKTDRDRTQTPNHVLPGSSRHHVQPSEASLPDRETFLLFRMLPKEATAASVSCHYSAAFYFRGVQTQIFLRGEKINW